MGSAEIDVRTLKAAVDAVLDHLVEDLGVEHVQIEDTEDYYWDCGAADRRPESKPADPEIGRLSDDADFVKLIKRDESGAASYNLVHIAPLLRFIGEKIKK
jgi:hypothetical protein